MVLLTPMVRGLVRTVVNEGWHGAYKQVSGVVWRVVSASVPGVAGVVEGEIKKELIDVITPMVLRHQKARALVTDDQVRTFMTPRKLNLSR